ncbi:hypothetical protein BZG36_01298 [Bifiguratus adelaidae]|uniref:Uncharacterized protein n=1 Tax=Bifiguratus adelaidae TaxID=1938954 RepID=A0A261Y5D5_9FUNG|nr:hypothetical protein BZG36_01298 [Bifiguratus adelaidae]
MVEVGSNERWLMTQGVAETTVDAQALTVHQREEKPVERIPLGKALYLLQQANDKAFSRLRHESNETLQDPLQDALTSIQSFLKHPDQETGLQHAQVFWDAIHPELRKTAPIASGPKKGTNPAFMLNRAMAIIQLLSNTPNISKRLLSLLELRLPIAPNVEKLGILRALIAIWDLSKQDDGEESIDGDLANHWACQIFDAGIATASNGQPTLLSSLAVDVVLVLSATAATCAHDFSFRSRISPLLKVVKQWHISLPLLDMICDETRSWLDQDTEGIPYNGFQILAAHHLDNTDAANLWKLIAPHLSSRSFSRSTKKAQVPLQNCIDREHMDKWSIYRLAAIIAPKISNARDLHALLQVNECHLSRFTLGTDDNSFQPFCFRCFTCDYLNASSYRMLLRILQTIYSVETPSFDGNVLFLSAVSRLVEASLNTTNPASEQLGRALASILNPAQLFHFILIILSFSSNPSPKLKLSQTILLEQKDIASYPLYANQFADMLQEGIESLDRELRKEALLTLAILVEDENRFKDHVAQLAKGTASNVVFNIVLFTLQHLSKTNLDIFLRYLEHFRHYPKQVVPEDEPLNPAQIRSSAKWSEPGDASDQETQRLTQVLQQWVIFIPEDALPPLIRLLASKTFAAPSELFYIRLWGLLAPKLSASIVSMRQLLMVIQSQLATQSRQVLHQSFSY